MQFKKRCFLEVLEKHITNMRKTHILLLLLLLHSKLYTQKSIFFLFECNFAFIKFKFITQ